MSDCIFCKIIDKKIPAKMIYEDDMVLAFEDINPQAPVHFLVIPKKHIPTILDVSDSDKDMLIHLFAVVNKLAKEKGVSERGFRIINNCNHESGQTVYHIHFHVLGGRPMAWPPG
ncbi:MAG: histidine triad nucleotide-binding protein [Nitrospirae bacterium]|nr:MAG: histidine triad nucleotide-binding protein [Nitrospirota bacterium]